ncbi:MAG: methyltransferase, TIGR04325 family [Woeseiaceae bacterium]|nr:methyltransferase, TIGR04325 family [Woeseiaceae bacterium]
MLRAVGDDDQPTTLRRLLSAVRRRVIGRLYPVNGLRGVFDTFEAARLSAPKHKPVGYDDAGTAAWYSEKFDEIWLEDYPALFWLQRGLVSGGQVLEIGGHVGQAFYAFSRFLETPREFTWTILDVPSIAQEGRRIAEERGAANLNFVEKLDAVSEADVVFAAGSLQYINRPILIDTIRSVERKPEYVIVSNTPIYDGKPFITLQNIGTAFCAYRIFNRSEMLAALQDEGYELIDSWHKPRKVRIPKRPDLNFDHYSGLCFRREESAPPV